MMNWYRMGEIEENIPRKKPLRLVLVIGVGLFGDPLAALVGIRERMP